MRIGQLFHLLISLNFYANDPCDVGERNPLQDCLGNVLGQKILRACFLGLH